MNEYTQIISLLDFSKNNPAESLILEKGAFEIAKVNHFSLVDNEPIHTAQQDGIAVLEADSLVFPSEDNLNVFYSLHLVKQHLTSYLSNPTALADALVNLKHLLINKATLKLMLIILKNHCGVDVLGLLGRVSIENFWFLYSYGCKAIPFIEVDVDTIESALEALLKQTENDGTQRELFTAMSELAENQPNRGQQIINHLVTSSKESPKFFINSMLKGLSKALGVEAVFPQVKKLIEDDPIEHQKQGLFAASIFDYSDSESSRNQLAYLGMVLEEKASGESDELLPLIVCVYDNLLTQLPQAKAKISLLSEADNPGVKYNVALAIWRSGKSKTNEDNEWQREVLLKLASTRVEYEGATRTINYVLDGMVDESPSIIVDFANEWMQYEYHEPSDISVFASTFIKLYNTNPSVFQALVTNWFNQNDMKYPATVATLLGESSFNDINNITLHPASLAQLKSEDIRFVLYKIQGFVYSKEHLRSLVFSILKGKPNDQQVEELVLHAFTTYITYNYPSTDEDFLREKAKQGTKQEKAVAKRIIKELDSYFQQRRDLPVLLELAASEHRENLRQKAYAKILAKSYEQHQKDTPSLASMMTTIQLKSGGTSFAKIDGEYTDEFRLGKIQSTMELPRGELIDPVGQEKWRFIWRTYTRP